MIPKNWIVYYNVLPGNAPVEFTLDGDDDTRNFDDFDDEDVNTTFENTSTFVGNHLPFVGFSYNYEYTPFKDSTGKLYLTIGQLFM